MRALLFIASFVIIGLPSIVLAQENVSVSPEELYTGGPSAPIISSLTHPDEDAWYRISDAVFTWELPAGIVAVAAEASTESGREPMRSFRPPVSSIVLNGNELVEGINYLAVQFRTEEKWGMYTERVIKIDKTPPEAFSITVDTLEGEMEKSVISFEARDMLSGVSHYELYINNRAVERMTPADARRGYLLRSDLRGQQDIKVLAYDQAGNVREAHLSLFQTVVSADKVLGMGIVAKEPATVLVGIMAAIMLMMFGYLIYERLRYARRVRDLRKETAEVHSQLIRIFTALREEIYDQIRSINSKQRLSKKEKEAIAGLDKALNVSESLIAKEVKDVKKLLAD